ncbi:unnamed protein product [Cochlearia groenlandica]
MMAYMNETVNPSMIISKQLTKSDVEGNITLPKQQVLNVLTKMNGVTVQSLQNGVQVQVLDILENDLYTVTLKCSGDNTRFYFGNGWSIMKHSLDLEEGQVLKMHWDFLIDKFVILNYSYSVLQFDESGIELPIF